MTSHSTLTTSERGIWTIDPAHTHAGFAVRHMMISTVRGQFSDVEGSIAFDEGNFPDSSVEVRIGVASIDTGNPDRDAHLRSADFFDVENHPDMTFRSREVRSTKEGIEVVGDLTLRGTTREVIFQAEALGTGQDPWGQQRVAFQAQTKLNRKEFGLTWNQALETGGVLVGEDVRISLDVQAIAADAEG